MDEYKKPSTSGVFPIALIAAMALFFYLIYADIENLFLGYSTTEKVVAFIISCIIGGVIFAVATGLINAIYKAIIEILVVILLFSNAMYVAFFYAKVRFFFEASYIDTSEKIKRVALILLGLFLYNIIFVVILIPFARIAKSDLLDG